MIKLRVQIQVYLLLSIVFAEEISRSKNYSTLTGRNTVCPSTSRNPEPNLLSPRPRVFFFSLFSQLAIWQSPLHLSISSLCLDCVLLLWRRTALEGRGRRERKREVLGGKGMGKRSWKGDSSSFRLFSSLIFLTKQSHLFSANFGFLKIKRRHR